jgi:hypothetical protein
MGAYVMGALIMAQLHRQQGEAGPAWLYLTFAAGIVVAQVVVGLR